MYVVGACKSILMRCFQRAAKQNFHVKIIVTFLVESVCTKAM